MVVSLDHFLKNFSEKRVLYSALSFRPYKKNSQIILSIVSVVNGFVEVS